jgi:8-oxo-dGTP pyrophosphatase MutT (NUDIX family)
MYNQKMKMLSVVFPVWREGDTNFILMGKQAAGKRMPGIRNGFGGKCEEGERVEDCAVREVEEEIGIKLETKDLRFVGTIVEGEKQVFFYTTQFTTKVQIDDSGEFVDCRWFDVAAIDTYIHEMLPGNDAPMRELAQSLQTPKEFKPFEYDMSDNTELMEATRHIFGKLQ